jgi:hypothetical protein
MRGLSQEMMNNLKNGELNSLLELVKHDHTLCLEIRENYLNIYYRGGNLLRIENERDHITVFFDSKYCGDKSILTHMRESDIDGWIKMIPTLKHEMDHWFVNKKESLEREFQQLILRENNFCRIANDTDYYFADLEYANRENKSRFDMIGIHWPSTSASKKDGHNTKLAIFEVKYGDKALTDKSGLSDHLMKIWNFINDPVKVKTLREEAEILINQKSDLGLMAGIKRQVHISQSQPEFIFIFANHKPASTRLNRELIKLRDLYFYKELLTKVDIKIANSSFMGYGLYDCEMIDLESYLNSL